MFYKNVKYTVNFEEFEKYINYVNFYIDYLLK